MSNEALTWAFAHQIKPGPKFVLVALADYADEEHACFPSIEKISLKTGIAKKTVRNHLNALEECLFLTRERRRYDDGNLGTYRFTLRVGLDVCINNSSISLRRSKARGRAFKSSPVANLASSQPVAKLGRTSALNLPDNNPHNNHQSIIIGIDFFPDALNPSTKTAKLCDDLFTRDEMELFLDRFIQHHIDKKTKSKDFNKQWRTWMQNQCQWRLEKNAKGNNGSRSAGRYVPVAQQRADAREEGIAAAEALLAEHGYE